MIARVWRLARLIAAGVAIGVALAVPGDVAAQAATRTHAPGVTTDFRVVTYEVTGSTAAELRAAMLSQGPTSGGRRWFGYTTWDVRWRFRYARDAAGCRMSRVAVELSSEITMPEWDPPAGAAPALVTDWREFERSLGAHEKGHRDIGLETACEIRRALRSLRRPDCYGMDREANDVARRVLDRFREREREYDRRTSSGRTQGAVWPPDSRDTGPAALDHVLS